jgi:regulator of protease activity HflC (stomatin/prohibitin superfamily)
LHIDGILYYRIINAKSSCYNVNDPVRALKFLAQTAMRSEIGLMDLDTTFKEREKLNAKIRLHLDHTAEGWGIQCMRYEIKDIIPPKKISQVMDL